MKRGNIILFISMLFIFVSCKTTEIIDTEEINKTQTEQAVQIAKSETLTESAVSDAQYLLEIVETTGDEDLIYIATKHVTEVQKLSTIAEEQKTTQEKATTQTSQIISTATQAKDEVKEIKTELKETRKSYASLILFIVLIAIALLVFLFIKFYSKLRAVFTFLP